MLRSCLLGGKEQDGSGEVYGEWEHNDGILYSPQTTNVRCLGDHQSPRGVTDFLRARVRRQCNACARVSACLVGVKAARRSTDTV